VHAAGISDWQLVYSREQSRIVRAQLSVTVPGEPIPPLPRVVYRGAADKAGPTRSILEDAVSVKEKEPSSLNPCAAHAQLCSPPLASDPNPRTVEFLFATTRASAGESHRVSFSGERGSQIVYGAARVRIPEDHRIGRIELPKAVTFLGFELYEQKTDPKAHFIIKEVRPLSEADLAALLSSSDHEEALVFVHGYNTSFDDSLYRMAQIVWDLQYRKSAFLFSWASRAGKFDYIYDQQSALIAANGFADFLKDLTTKYGIKRLHVLAHSMGNFVLMEAMKTQKGISDPLKIAELIMAAPDVDRDYFRQYAADLRKLTEGMTLYASSTDKAMTLSKTVAGGIPRAGDVPADGPIVVPGIDTIDVSAVGSDLLGLNHDVFASRRDVLNDIALLLSSRPRKPPNQRLVEILGMPEGVVPPKFWRYQ
jgi:esterase/lipase superfamily enzyme